jgi:hypothetical protein
MATTSQAEEPQPHYITPSGPTKSGLARGGGGRSSMMGQ